MKPPILLSILLTYSLQVSASALNDSNILFDWAEKNYPQNFSPSGIPTESIGTYLARYYPITNTYIGILGNDVYVLGKVFGDGIIRVGSISDFITTTLESHIKDENFTGTLLVKKNNSYILQKGFEFSDKAQQFHNNVDTRYRIGSLTKAFTALAIVQLKKTNMISSYDDSVSNYIQNYPRGEEISIRHLLTHRSGIPEHLSKINPNKSYPPSELVDLFKKERLDFKPGKQFSYSNSNYVLLGHLIEIISGLSYEDYLKKNILDSLGMFRTQVGNNIISGPEYAKGYQDTTQVQIANFIDMSIPYSAGWLSSNVIDMGIWAESIINKTLFSELDAQEMFSEFSYGFGWLVTKIDGKSVYLHTGGINGFSSAIVILPEEKSYIIALSNVEADSDKLQRIVTFIIENEF